MCFQGVIGPGMIPMSDGWDDFWTGSALERDYSSFFSRSDSNECFCWWFRNPAFTRSPVEVGSLSLYYQGFIHRRWLAGFLPSDVPMIVGIFFLGSALEWDYFVWKFQVFLVIFLHAIPAFIPNSWSRLTSNVVFFFCVWLVWLVPHWHFQITPEKGLNW